MKTAVSLLLTFLFNASWQIAAVAGFACCGSWLLRENSARYRHAIWVAALILSLALPLMSCVDLFRTSIATRQTPAQPASEPVNVARNTAAPEEIGLQRSSAPLDPVEPVRSAAAATAVLVNRKLAFSLFALFALFLSYRAANLIRAWLRTRVIRRSTYAVEMEEPLSGIVRNCQAAIGVKRVRIFSSLSVAVPITAGIVNPLIILPEQLLKETNEDMLRSAVGHELVHIARRDYTLNLIYELIYLPLSFHPAAALIRRSIKRTRELCCDERVTEQLVNPELYARSLVSLVGAAPLAGFLPADTTIGIAESDILEVRIMSLLRRPKLTPRRNRLLLIAVSLLLIMPCVAAARLALSFDIDRTEPQEPTVKQQPGASERFEQKQERVREELKRLALALKEQAREAPEAQRSEVEARLREVQQNLEEHRRILDEHARLRQPNEQQERQYREALEKLQSALAVAEASRPETEERYQELREKLTALNTEDLAAKLNVEQLEELLRAMDEGELPQKEEYEKLIEKLKTNQREVEERLKVEEYEESRNQVLDKEASRKAREQELLKKRKVQELDMEARRKNQEQEELKMRKFAERKGKYRVKGAVDLKWEEPREDELIRRQAELARSANIPLNRAIQIAVGKHPGQVMTGILSRGPNGRLSYCVTIINREGEKATFTYVWVSAVDGQILKIEK